MKLHEFEMDTRSNPAQKLNKDLENGVQWQLKNLNFVNTSSNLCLGFGMSKIIKT